MEALYARCAGLDGRQKTGVACRVFPPESGRKQQEARPLDATTRARLTWLDWLDWLREGGGTQGAWESTGEYGKPGSYLLEEPAELLRVNLQHVKNGPGRKTEGKDAEGRAALLRQGLVQGSFVPGRPPREWRDLTRGRCPLIEERTRIVIRKTLLPFDSKLPEPAPLTRI